MAVTIVFTTRPVDESIWNDHRDITLKTRLEIGFDRLKERWISAPAEMTGESLTILGHPVMEAWEESYMRALAAVAAMRGGRVLEIGFGMGISASFLQRHDIDEHVIIEANRDVFRRTLEFSSRARTTVTPHFGFWESVVLRLPDASFDGILFDTYPLRTDEVHRNHFPFFPEAHRLLRPGGVFTYYSDEEAGFSVPHRQALERAGFRHMTGRAQTVATPSDCRYWNRNTLFVPVVIKDL